MQSFQILTSCIIPLPIENVDTDQIIPARFLKVTDKNGLSEGLFSSWRYRADGSPDPGFPLNQADYQNCKILLVGDNFGCGSSREHAPWALVDWGFRAIISASFADIFRNNALKNGLLPVVVDSEILRRLFMLVEHNPRTQVTIDLLKQKLFLPEGSSVTFPIDSFSKICMLEGIDPLGYILKHENIITDFESNFQNARTQGQLK